MAMGTCGCATEQHADARVGHLAAEVQRMYAESDRLRMEVYGLREMVDRENAKNDELRDENARLVTRLEAYCSAAIDPEGCDQGGCWPATCWVCGAEADTSDAIRHVAGTRIGEHACAYLLDMRALGWPVLDDAEEVAP